jgi:prepilin-type N-terminal cleavage/methylation domain-containing protein
MEGVFVAFIIEPKDGGLNMSKGFTLIELVIIIVVLGILAAIAIPKYRDMQSSAMESSVRGFGASLKEASTIYLSQAVLEHSTRNPLVQSFWDFVALSEGASDRNTITINNSIRHLLRDPNANVLSGDGLTITLDLKGGAVATYTFNPTNSAISDSYAGF